MDVHILDHNVTRRLAGDADMESYQPRPVSRVQKHFRVDTEVRFEQLPGKDMTVMNIVATDRPGLLARIAQAFMEQEIRIHNAKIATAGEEARDIFHITDNDNQPLLDEQACQQLRDAVIRHINQ